MVPHVSQPILLVLAHPLHTAMAPLLPLPRGCPPAHRPTPKDVRAAAALGATGGWWRSAQTTWARSDRFPHLRRRRDARATSTGSGCGADGGEEVGSNNGATGGGEAGSGSSRGAARNGRLPDVRWRDARATMAGSGCDAVGRGQICRRCDEGQLDPSPCPTAAESGKQG